MASFVHQLRENDAVQERLLYICITIVATPILYLVARAIYNVYIHPLHVFPGPKAWIAFPFLQHLASMRGEYDIKLRAFHEQYGEVIRYAPNSLSFITAQAWKDIYGHGHRQLPKAILGADDPAANNHIIVANDADHSRYRKSISHAFSEKALSQQEPLMKVYIDQLIAKLACVADSGEETDMVQWYNLTTFDLIGDLAFGAPFGGLEHGQLHEWIAMIFRSLRLLVLSNIALQYPWVMKPILALTPRRILESRDYHRNYTRATVHKRINNTALNGRGDFMDAMLRHRGDKDGLSDAELVANANILIVAGSETTATLLSGVTYWLLRTPAALKKATDEVRAAFATEDEINFVAATARLPYMLACLEEAFRKYPPVPTGLQRIVPPGAPVEISGFSIPAGTIVSVHQSAANSSARNFANPTAYIPERWLPHAGNASTPSPYASDNRAVLQPFSVGPRNCVGRNLAYNEMRLILARVLWSFDLELCARSARWQEVQRTFILWEKPGLWCRLRRRPDKEKAA